MSEPTECTPETQRVTGQFVRRVLVFMALALLAVLVVWLMHTAVTVLLMGFAAILVAILISSIAEPLIRWTGMWHGAAVVVVLLLLLGVGAGLGVLVVPSFVNEIEELAQTLPKQSRQIEQKLTHYEWGRLLLNHASGGTDETEPAETASEPDSDGTQSDQEGEDLPVPFIAPATRPATTQPATTQSHAGDAGVDAAAPKVKPITRTMKAAAEPIMSGASSFASTAVNALVGVFIILAVGIYFAIEPKLYFNGFLHLLPKSARPLGSDTVLAIHHALRWWLIGQGVTMLVIGTLTGLGLWLIGVRLWLTFAILAGAFNFVPNFGPLVSFAPAILFTLADANSGHKVLWITGLYIVAQTFEGYVLTPLIQKRAVDSPPALLILFQMLAGLMMGALGLMLAAPLMAMIVVATKMLYVRHGLGDRSVRVPGEA